MRFFKYLVFFSIILFSSASYSYFYVSGYENITKSSTRSQACSKLPSHLVASDGGGYTYSVVKSEPFCQLRRSDGGLLNFDIYEKAITCPSATEVTLKVSINAQKYQCVNQCQYALRGCVDIDFEPGMTCSAISTGIDCGGTPPPKPPKPDDPVAPDSDSGIPAAPGQNSSNTNTNTATTTGTSTSTSTSTTTNNTATNTSTTNTTTTTNINTTTKIDLSSLESAIESIGKLLGGKLDAIKEALGADSGSENGSPDGTDLTETNKKLDDIKNNGDKLNNWLQGKNEDGTGGGVGDNPFGTDVTPERTIDAQSFKTNIFQSNAQCPADKTLSMTLFTGRTFSRTLSFSMWCDKLAIFGSLILIAAYLYGALIIVRDS
jgi:hypothetical protein